MAEQQQENNHSQTFIRKASSQVLQAANGWNKFKNWNRNGSYLRTLGGLLCIAFCLKWAIAGATFAFLFNTYTSLVQSWCDTAITSTWHTLPVHIKIVILAAGISIVLLESHVPFVSLFLFPIQILADVCAAKLGMDLAVHNMRKSEQ
mmetsp:Transcript_55624/g.92507  ORF Transcript_55624/g.92507 Transcript_55624/m.92507 type:complete len:148 (+) Transcript_55624:32-475(+)